MKFRNDIKDEKNSCEQNLCEKKAVRDKLVFLPYIAKGIQFILASEQDFMTYLFIAYTL